MIPFPSTRATHVQHILRVEFTSPDGRAWQAVGGGDTLAAVGVIRDAVAEIEVAWEQRLGSKRFAVLRNLLLELQQPT